MPVSASAKVSPMNWPCILLALLPAAALGDVFTFETPSGNIDCSVGVGAGPSDIICTIHERNGPPAAPRPAGCGSDWGHTFSMRNRGPAQILCEPKGENHQMYERAEYGVTGRMPGIDCTSSRQGLECINEDGHGFFLSRASQRLF